ncbi:MAG TPA: sulfur oxidation c-type cytochrome SoxA [Arcobacter sp.]|nr:sulfur oxidation c-type cytochrome SoxA [Arcobacter sp.]
MLSKLVKSSVVVALATTALSAGGHHFDAQAEKDRKALIKYFEDKFEDPYKNKDTFFPYSTDDELKNNIIAGLKHQDFALGNYAFSENGQVSYEAIKEMPPYEELVEKGEEIYEGNAALKKCFPDTTIGGDYPYYSQERKQVVTLTQAINECLVNAGEKKLNEKKGTMAFIQAFMAQSTQDAEKKVNIKIESAEAAAAYERGKQYYYAQRGYLKLSCATCHVQGTAQRVRNESLSQLLGHTTHFPVYRLKWGKGKVENGLGTLERRMQGCIKDQGQNPPKTSSNEMKELLYFMSYMSNGMMVDGPDLRK